MLAPSHSFMIYDGPKAFTSTTIFKKCVKTNYGEPERHIQKINEDLPYPIYEFNICDIVCDHFTVGCMEVAVK